jgi:hypothetical protein
MRPYLTIRLIEDPDISDIIEQGRKSSVGKINYNKGYCSSKKKKKMRRHLKRSDKARIWKEILQ